MYNLHVCHVCGALSVVITTMIIFTHTYIYIYNVNVELTDGARAR